MIYELKLLSESLVNVQSAADPARVPDGFGLPYDAARSNAHILSDGFGRLHTYLRISLVEHCNLRCRYCMPDDGLEWTPDEQLLTDEEIVRLASLFARAGVSKIRLTGGEPLLRPRIESIAGAIAALPGIRTLAMTTNGLLLRRKLPALQRAGLNLLNLSLDTLRPDRFEAITRRKGLHLVLKALDVALEMGYHPLKVNCVVMHGINDDELTDFVALTRDRPIEVRFIEFMPFDGNKWDERQLVSYADMKSLIERLFPLTRSRNGPNDTSRTYQVPGFVGSVGFITSMTDNFCEGCNRLRITADGHLKVCLFGRSEVCLRDAMRSGASDRDLEEIISLAIGRKFARHAGMHAIAASRNRPMIQIGG
ncbi:MAG: GTP 3',8-cyclase MoaA [Bacteroidota bacterium]|nr:GTP 3',8-cyclase MoaA [Bacteroidota bacterium]